MAKKRGGVGGEGGSIFFLDHACGLAPGKKDPLLFLENSSVNVLQCIVWAIERPARSNIDLEKTKVFFEKKPYACLNPCISIRI